MKLVTLQEAKYAHGRTLDKVLRFFDTERSTYGPEGNELLTHKPKPGLFIKITDEQYSNLPISSISMEDYEDEGQIVWVSYEGVHDNADSFKVKYFLERVEVHELNRIL